MKKGLTLSSLFIFLCFLLLPGWVSGQEIRDSSDLIEIIGAEISRLSFKNGENKRELFGNVVLKQDSVIFRADTASILNQSDASARRNISISQGEHLDIFAEKLNYGGVQRIAILTEEVVLQNRETKLFTDSLHYDLKTKIGTFVDTALVTDGEAQLGSIKGIFYVNERKVKFRDSVVIIHPDFILRTDSLLYDMEKRRATFLGPTIIHQNDAKIYTEAGYYDIVNKIGVFNKNPQYVEGDKVLLSKSMRYEGRQNEVYIDENVRYRNKDVFVTTKKIIYNDSTKIADFKGDVDYSSDGAEMQSEQAIYNTETDEFYTRGRTEIVDGDRVFGARHIDFKNESGIGTAHDRVSIRDTVEGYHILADTAYFDRENSVANASGGRQLIILGKAEEDSIFISAGRSNTYLETEDTLSNGEIDSVRILIAHGDVRIFGEQLSGVCDSLSFDGADSTFVFYGNPTFWKDSTQFKADTIFISMENGEIKRLFLSRNATVISTTDEIFFDQISGKSITGSFEEGEVRSIVIDGNASSLIYAKDGEEYIAADRATASFITVIFKEEQLSGVKYSNAYESEALPIEGTNHEGLKIENFTWLLEEKPTSIESLNAMEELLALYRKMR